MGAREHASNGPASPGDDSDGEPERVTDADERPIWISTATQTDRYHTDPDCTALSTAKRVRKTTRDDVNVSATECGVCAGTATSGGNPNSGNCDTCGQRINTRYLEDGECIGCRTPTVMTDGGTQWGAADGAADRAPDRHHMTDGGQSRDGESRDGDGGVRPVPPHVGDHVRELNSVPLTGLDAAREALDHYNDDYHDGEMYEAEGGDCLIIISRSGTFQHFSLFQQCEHVRIGNVRSVYRDDLKRPKTRVKVELREVDR